MMQRWQQLLPLLCLTAAVLMDKLGDTAKTGDGDGVGLQSQQQQEVKNRTDGSLQAFPLSDNSSFVAKLVIEGRVVVLTEGNRQALAGYPALQQLHLDGNQVTEVPARFFSVVPQLQLLSLSSNNISSLDPEAFMGLDVLTELDLSHNQLTRLPTQLLSGLKNLKVLKLEGNPWNCSCSLLSSIREVAAANVTIGATPATCASPGDRGGVELLEAVASCYTSTPHPSTTDPQTTTAAAAATTTTTTVVTRSSSTGLKTTLSGFNRDQNISPGPTPLLGNTWKFTACVAALATVTSMLIMGAVKGPSWYKQFHNYRHRRLDPEEDGEGEGEGGDFVSTVFSGTYVQHQTFVFEEEEDGQIEMEEEEEDEDGYFEDPYIKRDE